MSAPEKFARCTCKGKSYPWHDNDCERGRELAASAGSAPKWQPGQIARFVNRACPRRLILEVCEKRGYEQTYCTLGDSGTVGYDTEQNLLTLDEWLKWWERFRDEVTGKEHRECADNARKEFVPPDWWDKAVAEAQKPYEQNR